MIAAAIASALAAPARALELTLEENRGETGSIGYVDMDRVFARHPETAKAKEEFVILLNDKKTLVELKKNEIAALRAKLGILSDKRRVLVARIEAETQKVLSDAALVAELASSTPQAQGQISPGELAAPEANPAPAVSVSTGAIKLHGYDMMVFPDNHIEKISDSTGTAPGAAAVSDAPAPQAAIPVSATTASTAAVYAPAISGGALALPATGQASAQSAQPPATDTPGSGGLPVSTAAAQVAPLSVVVSTGIAVSTAPPVTVAALLEADKTLLFSLEAEIAPLEKELAQKRGDLKALREKTEKELADMENRRSEIILGKIYAALRHVATEEGISVVVDKGSTLYGRKTVDLTDKLLEHIRNE